MATQRRALLAWLALPLAGCGFQLRSSQVLPFDTMAVSPENGAGVAADMVRYLGSAWRPLAPGANGERPQATLYILQELREKIIVALNASGQVREYELRLRVNFRLVSATGEEVIPSSFIEQHRSISFNESAVLAKEAEETLLYRDMQSDVVQQLLRRLAVVKPAAPRQP